MPKRIRYQTVVVGVIYDAQLGFLLRYNPPWKKYAFVMKKPNDEANLDDLALVALDGDLHLKFPDASARPLDQLGAWGTSGRTGELTYYNYLIYQINLGESRAGSAQPGVAQWLSYDELQRSPDVTWSTQEIARALVENREIVAAAMIRSGQQGPECLLIDHPRYGYFLPSVARRTDDSPDELAKLAVELDTGYDGAVQAEWLGETEFLQPSQRFGAHTVTFRCHICRAELKDCDLHAHDGPLATSLRAIESRKAAEGQPRSDRGYAEWVPVESLGSMDDVSPTMKSIRLFVERAATSV